MLDQAIDTLKSHEAMLRARGVVHAAVFGSTARGTDTDHSDIDIVIDLDEARTITVFDYVDIKDAIGNLFNGRADVVIRAALKKQIASRVDQEAVDAF